LRRRCAYRKVNLAANLHIPTGIVADAPPIVGEEHEDEQEAVGGNRDHEEIGRYDLADVISQECAPSLRWRLVPAHHVFRDGRLTDGDPEFGSSP
jgi:hypothetical protein